MTPKRTLAQLKAHPLIKEYPGETKDSAHTVEFVRAVDETAMKVPADLAVRR